MDTILKLRRLLIGDFDPSLIDDCRKIPQAKKILRGLIRLNDVDDIIVGDYDTYKLYMMEMIYNLNTFYKEHADDVVKLIKFLEQEYSLI